MKDPTAQISAAYRAQILDSHKRRRDDIAEQIFENDELTVSSLAFGFAPPDATTSEIKRIAQEKREEIIDFVMKTDSNGTMVQEQTWYEHTKVFLPPPQLWSRHPLIRKSGLFGENMGRPNRDPDAFTKARQSFIL